jgi:CHRD domain
MSTFGKKFVPVYLVLFVCCTTLCFVQCTNNNSNQQNTPIKYDLILTGENHTPAVNNAGRGTFTGTYDKSTKTMTYTATWTLNNGAIATMAHFHGPASSTQNAGIQIGMFMAQNTTGNFSGTATLSATQETDLLAGRWYINIHSTLNGSGALRVQLPAQN